MAIVLNEGIGEIETVEQVSCCDPNVVSRSSLEVRVLGR